MLAAVGCGHGEVARRPPGTGEVREAYYTDNTGLSVVTTATRAEQGVSRNVSVWGRAIADYLSIQRKPFDPGDPNAQKVITGHHDGPTDVTTSASAIASGGGLSEKWRFDGTAGVVVRGAPRKIPMTAGAEVRGSVEPDYRSASGVLRGSIDLNQQNTTLAGFVGYGHDTVSPTIAPPGQRGLWPATHERWFGGISVTQLLSAKVVLTAGAAATGQRGMLASPYRRALVRTTLFPEDVPSTRDRYTGFVGVAWSVVPRLALHGRLGGYADTWNVFAIIPEAAGVVQLGHWGLLDIRYRYYQQTKAYFYKPVYDEIERLLSGDQRLGVIHAHSVGGELRALVFSRPGGDGSVTLAAGYDAGLLDYDLLGIATVVAHVVQLAILGSW